MRAGPGPCTSYKNLLLNLETASGLENKVPTIQVMMPGLRFFRTHAFAVAFVTAAILIGCGGGGGTATHLTGGANGGSTATGTTSGATGTTSGATGTTSGATGTTSGDTGTTSGATGTTSGSTGSTSGTTGGDPGPWILFETDQTGNLTTDYMHLDGASRATLAPSGLNTDMPAMSKDATKVAFVDWSSFAHIYSCAFDGTGLTNLTPGSSDNLWPHFNPAGDKIVFSSDRGGNYQVFVMDADGSGVVKLTNLSSGAYQPRWSPDGTKIAFVAGDTNDDVFIMNADGSGLVQLTSNSANENQPTWSPDGSKIVFVRDFGTDLPNGQLMIVSSSGGSATRLTNTLQDDGEPCFSQDGSVIYFSEDNGGGREIKKINSGGGSISIVTNDGATASHPSTGT